VFLGEYLQTLFLSADGLRRFDVPQTGADSPRAGFQAPTMARAPELGVLIIVLETVSERWRDPWALPSAAKTSGGHSTPTQFREVVRFRTSAIGALETSCLRHGVPTNCF